jgi:Holliday junction resolvasome RuvABC ATP-dependent DNA helicase subunit
MAVDERMSSFIYFLDSYKPKDIHYFDINRILYNINSDFVENKYYDSAFVGKPENSWYVDNRLIQPPSTIGSGNLQTNQNPFYILYDKSKINERMDQSLETPITNAYDMWKQTHEANLSLPEPKPIVKTQIYIDISVNSFTDLIHIIDKHKYSEDCEYNIDLKSLTNIREELVQLNDMIGMTTLKKSILDQLFYFIQNLHISNNISQPIVKLEGAEALNKTIHPENVKLPDKCKANPFDFCPNDESQDFIKLKIKTNMNKGRNSFEGDVADSETGSSIASSANVSDTSDFKHTVICGPPGTGKTEVAKIIGKMYSKIGVLKKNTFKKVTRGDLVAGYLGQTALKTKNVINDSLGGVLFIDEAYSLGNNRDTDSYSKECIDTLCEAMSDHKHDLMVIIAGYENELEDTFFSVNRGMDSRFIWRFKIDEYNSSELTQIFKKKVLETDWTFENIDDIQTKWFDKRKQEFRNYGRDMELLFSFAKISHARRIYGKPPETRKKLSLDDLNNGYDTFIKNIKKNSHSKVIEGLYV